MEKEAIFTNDMVQCVCGNSFDVDDFIDEFESDTTSNNSSEETEIFHCEMCDREYAITFKITVSTEVDCQEIKEIKKCTEYHDKNNEIIPSSYFEALMIGDNTPLLYDGNYICGEYLYQIKNGKLDFRFSNIIAPNQIDMFELGIKLSDEVTI